MRVEVVMPQMGESIVEGTVVNWHKSEGDKVKRDEDIFTISTDKVDADIPSPAEGILESILVEVGKTVEVGTVVAFIQTDASEMGKGEVETAKTEAAPAPSQAARATEPARGADGLGEVVDVEELRRTRSTPLVRRIAREHGIQDLSIVPGTGVSGRVTKRDILEYIDQADEMTTAAQDEEDTAPVPAPGREAEAVAPSVDRVAIEVPKIHIWDDDRVEPMSRMRKSIADHMVMSRRISPHVQSIWECDWTKAIKARQTLKHEFAQRGVKLTYTAFLVRAAVEALRANPIINSSVDQDRIVYRNRINVGIAVALEDGLIVPVVKRADELSLLGIARAVNDLTERAREKKLSPDEVEGGTFTISNPGVFGSLFGIPVINQPQVAILGVGAIQKRLVVDDDDNIRIVAMNTMCLSFDHRVVDGAAADFFMRDFVGFIEGFDASRAR